MRTVLVDTSVVIKWFHHEDEPGLAEALALRRAVETGQVEARVIDLCCYELGNVLLRALRWPASLVADQLEDLVVVCGAPLSMTAAWLRRAAALGGAHALTFYDAAWAAAAEELEVPLVSADARLLAAGLAEDPASLARRFGLVVQADPAGAGSPPAGRSSCARAGGRGGRLVGEWPAGPARWS